MTKPFNSKGLLSIPENQELLEGVDFKGDIDEALKWMKVKSRREGETLALSYIADMLHEAEKLERISWGILQRRADAYDYF